MQNGGRWPGADGNGVFRYEILDDKIQYPTTLAWRDLALIVDTHGFSALVEPARGRGLAVVGCGLPDKMAAAFASRGSTPGSLCDRYAGDLVAMTRVLIGSAPVRRKATTR